jgi:hypothetical protein
VSVVAAPITHGCRSTDYCWHTKCSDYGVTDDCDQLAERESHRWKLFEHAPKPGGLLGRPQRLGLMPTWWFWNDKENWRFVRGPFMFLLIASTVALMMLQPALPLWAIAAIPGVVFTITLGLFERYIRRRALDRRKLTEALIEAKPALTPLASTSTDALARPAATVDDEL